jgi:hypothetical protein
MILLIGVADFDDICLPAAGKNEWGVDTLVRKMKGARSLLSDFLSSLSQGDTYGSYYLQTWEPDDDPVLATVTLTYKGLFDGIPEEDVQTEIQAAAGSCSKNYLRENDGKGRVYATGVLAQFGPVAPGPGEYGTTVKWTYTKYATAANMDFTYDAVQSTYRYITASKPSGPSHTTIDISLTPVVKRVRITTDTGAIYGLDMAGFFDLAPVEILTVVGFSSKHIIGTPYYECVDVVRKELGQAL